MVVGIAQPYVNKNRFYLLLGVILRGQCEKRTTTIEMAVEIYDVRCRPVKRHWEER